MTPDLPPACEPVAPIARAVKRLEWGSSPPRWNNPGALIASSGVGYRRYATLREGWIGLCGEIKRRLRLGATTASSFACGLSGRFGPWPRQDRCRAYAAGLSRLLGLDDGDRLSRILPAPHY